MIKIIRILFFLIVIRPVIFVVIGLLIRDRDRIPLQGPAVLIANHNSHLDTLVLMALFPLKKLYNVRPVAAADYFLKNKSFAWFSKNIMNIIPIERARRRDGEDPLTRCHEALDRKEILILYPEGSRGNPEEMTRFKKGIAHLMRTHPDIPIIPIFLQGLGRALPKGETVLVPFFCDIFIGQELFWRSSNESFMTQLEEQMNHLKKKAPQSACAEP
jgi:1-acyl-sn-glycerol-3-phosphate acyltransferase